MCSKRSPCSVIWQEVESEVYRPGLRLGGSVATVFLLAGAIGFLTLGGIVPPGTRYWVVMIGAAALALLGVAMGVATLCVIIWPARVYHTSLDVLPDVPREPLICEGWIVHGRVTHELCEDAQGWQYRPSERLWRNDKRFFFGFGIPFRCLLPEY